MSFAVKLAADEKAQDDAAAVFGGEAEVCASADACLDDDDQAVDVAMEATDDGVLIVTEGSADLDVQIDGEIHRPNGATYTGQVFKGFASGSGKQSWPSGAVYEGEWVDDQMHGHGTLTTPDGAQYNGRWTESRQHGEGKYTAPDNGFYEGQWTDGKMDGKGRYQWPDGAVFEGQFAQGEKSGEGVLRYANGSRYEGAWVDSKQHGMGVFTTKDGRSRRGEWVDGARERWLDDASAVVPENPKRQQTAPQCNFEIEQPGASNQRPGLDSGNCSDRCTQVMGQCVLM